MVGVSVEILRNVTIFADLGEETLERIASIAVRRIFPVDAVVFTRGECPHCLYIVLTGQIALHAGPDPATGRAGVVEVIGAYDHFILATALLDMPYLMSARALRDSVLACIPADELRTMLEREPRLAMVMLASVSTQYRALVRQLGDIKLHSAARRLASYLLDLAQEQEGRAATIVLPFDKRVLASWLAITPEHLSRAFATLRRQGVVTRGARVEIADRDALAVFAHREPEAAPPASAAVQGG
ncbi:MAG TPA: helix-turn-helix domain-containing protein [Stellaceae bacterium]|jgi:CRP/FNR family transcriptional activator FtrB